MHKKKPVNITLSISSIDEVEAIRTKYGLPRSYIYGKLIDLSLNQVKADITLILTEGVKNAD